MDGIEMRSGCTLLAKLPAGYDGRTRLCYYKPLRTIIIAHPDFQPCKLVDGQLEPIISQNNPETSNAA
jgi:hypothetical protein